MLPCVRLLMFLKLSSSMRVNLIKKGQKSSSVEQEDKLRRGHVSSRVENGNEWRVFSDLDDTLKCSGGPSISGMDINCNKHGEIYPGAMNFMLELSRGISDEEGVSPPKVVPLSARPQSLKFILAIKASDPLNVAFQTTAEAANITNWGLDIAGAQYGSLTNALSVAQGRFEAGLSQKKFAGWLAFNSSEPSYFIGDNGQGDVLAAEKMIDRQDSITFEMADTDGDGRISQEEFVAFMTVCRNHGKVQYPNLAWEKIYEYGAPSSYEEHIGSKEGFLAFLNFNERNCKYSEGMRPYLRAAFIHHIQYKSIDSYLLETAPNSKRDGFPAVLKRKNIFLFWQYGHAACKAHQQGFISDLGYARVMRAIKHECFANARKMADVVHHPRVACRILAPEFEIHAISPGGKVNIAARAANDCGKQVEFRKERSTAKGWVIVPWLLRGLTPQAFFPMHGFWAVERKCAMIDRHTPLGWMDFGILARLSYAMILLQKHGDASVKAGVPYMVEWVLKTAGLHCMSRCGETCDYEMKKNSQAWGRNYSNFAEKQSIRWQLQEVSPANRLVENCTPRKQRRVCRMVAQISSGVTPIANVPSTQELSHAVEKESD